MQTGRRYLSPELLVALVALVPRIGFVLYSPGGYRGTFVYDPSVYYGSAAALLHGRLPYADFVLVHPPGSTLVLLPFAALAHVTTDQIGFVTAQIVFSCIGAVNAALLMRIAKRLGYRPGAALAAGLVYALWPGVTTAEYASRLEPLGNLMVLLGLLAYLWAERTGRRGPAVLAGVAFGYAVSVKIWWLLTLAILIGWSLASRERRRRLAYVVAGVAATAVVVDLPFFVAAPRTMFRMVVTEQGDRTRMGTIFTRLRAMDGSGYMGGNVGRDVLYGLAAAFLVTVALMCVRALRVDHGPLWVALTVLPMVALLETPSYFPYYNDFFAPGLALVTAAAVHRGFRSAAGLAPRTAFLAPVVAVACAALALVDIVVPESQVAAYPSAALKPAVAHSHCVASDSPMAQIMLDVLDRDLGRGCRNWIDVTGRSFTYIAKGAPRRAHNRRWQRAVGRYLISGDTMTIFRRYQTGIAQPLWSRLLRDCPALAISPPFRVLAVTRACRRGVRSLG